MYMFLPHQLITWQNNWRRKSAVINGDTCFLFTEVYLFVYTLRLKHTNPPRLQVWLHVKWHCSEVLEGRDQFRKEPRWVALHNQADTFSCFPPSLWLNPGSNSLHVSDRWGWTEGPKPGLLHPLTCEESVMIGLMFSINTVFMFLTNRWMCSTMAQHWKHTALLIHSPSLRPHSNVSLRYK